MFQFDPKVVNTRDSLDHVPVLLVSVSENHPLGMLMTRMANELYLATFEWDWVEPR